MEVFEPVERAMVVTPHPDDAELGCGGTVAKLIGAGKEVFYVVATSGNKGGRDTDMSGDYLRKAREEEQNRAAEVLGVSEVVFLDFGDGELEDDHAFRRALVYQIRRLKPDIIFTTDPFRSSFYIHRDHRIAGLVTIDAAFPYARDRLHYPEHIAEGLSVHNVQEVYFWLSENPEIFVDIEDVIELKIKAIMEHSSQMQDLLGKEGNVERFRKRMKAWSSRAAHQYQTEFTYVEAFRKFGIRRQMEDVDEES